MDLFDGRSVALSVCDEDGVGELSPSMAVASCRRRSVIRASMRVRTAGRVLDGVDGVGVCDMVQVRKTEEVQWKRQEEKE